MINKKSIWLTYAWEDNEEGDVDFIAQELVRAGLEVKLDRWNIAAGKRLWEQIETFIQDPSESDGWVFYATQISLGSEACKEEFAYALDRALDKRGGNFPLIALFPSSVDRSLIPAGIKTRLYVSINDPSWKERIVAAVEKRETNINKLEVEPFYITVHKLTKKRGVASYAIEVRPRGGTWAPFFAAVPIDEKDHVSPYLGHGPAKHVPGSFMLIGAGEGISDDRKWWIITGGNEATPTQSYYVFCKKPPSKLIFGINGGSPQYVVTLS